MSVTYILNFFHKMDKRQSADFFNIYKRIIQIEIIFLNFKRSNYFIRINMKKKTNLMYAILYKAYCYIYI